jgi:hypothetical protein
MHDQMILLIEGGSTLRSLVGGLRNGLSHAVDIRNEQRKRTMALQMVLESFQGSKAFFTE